MNSDSSMRKMGLVALLLAAVLAVLQLAVPAHAAPAYPALSGRVSDAAGVLPADVAASLEVRLKQLEDTTGTQLVVATVGDLEGLEIDEYGVGLLRHWGIGQKGTNNGAILLVAPAQRKLRIEVGYGLEGTLTDAVSSQIIRRTIVPRIKAGDMAGGITAGADELIQLLQLPPDQQRLAAAGAARSAADSKDRPGLGAVVWLVILLAWMFMASRPGKRGRRRGPVTVWGPGIGGSWGGGGGGFGGGGFGGGGFGGGGGSGGGGGASGGW